MKLLNTLTDRCVIHGETNGELILLRFHKIEEEDNIINGTKYNREVDHFDVFFDDLKQIKDTIQVLNQLIDLYRRKEGTLAIRCELKKTDKFINGTN